MIKFKDISTLKIIGLLENTGELFRLNQYKSKEYIQKYLGLGLAKAGFYGIIEGDTAIAQPRNVTTFNSNSDVELLIEGIVSLDSIPVNTGSGSIVYQGYGVLEVNDTVIYDGRGGEPMSTTMYIVDSILGDDTTGIKNSYKLPFKTIAGAEAVASPGEFIRVITDIEEVNCGKNGLKYIFDRGCKLYWPAANDTPAGAPSAHLWSDAGKGAISFEVYGGIHESEGDWFGNFDRGIVYAENASNIKIYSAERISIELDDGDIIRCFADGANIELYSEGEIYSEYRLVQLSGANNNIILKAAGKITYKERGIQQIGDGASKVLVHSDTEIFFEGHYISALRSDFYCNNTGQELSHWTIQAPRIMRYELHPERGSGESGFLWTWANANIHYTVNADVMQLWSIDGNIYTDEGGVFGLNRTASGAYAHVDFNVKRLILGKGFKLDDTYNSIDRSNTLINIGDIEIIYLTDIAQNRNCIDGRRVRYVFNGVCKVIVNPVAIAAGQKVIGAAVNDSAFIIGKVITNGDVFDNTFTDELTGNNVATGIPGLIVNNTTLINYADYDELI